MHYSGFPSALNSANEWGNTSAAGLCVSAMSECIVQTVYKENTRFVGAVLDPSTQGGGGGREALSEWLFLQIFISTYDMKKLN